MPVRGRQLRFTGNNPVLSACLAGSRRGTIEADYQASVANRTTTPGTGAFKSGATTAAGYADFAQGYAPVTSTSDGGAGGDTVRGGETLSSIAANVWGDAQLW